MPKPRPVVNVPGLPVLPTAPPQQAIAVSEIPTDDEMLALGLKQEEFPRFVKAMVICELQMAGSSLKDACADPRVDIHYNTLSGKLWQDMLAKARKFIVGRLSHNVNLATSIVFERWPDIIRGIVTIAENGAEDRDKINATELLYSMYLANRADASNNVDDDYLKQAHNFTPFSVIQEAQITVNVNQPLPAPPTPLTIDDLSGQN